jgi:hypothetical protein
VKLLISEKKKLKILTEKLGLRNRLLINDFILYRLISINNIYLRSLELLKILFFNIPLLSSNIYGII